jgi:SH3-like domain-containing protein
MRSALIAISLAAAALLTGPVQAQAPTIGPDSQLPVPRYVSLKHDQANGRRGPSEEHRIDWVYQRPGLPLLVTAESGAWRRVTDPDGDQVWMHQQHLEERRTLYVRTDAQLRSNARGDAAVLAYLARGIVAPVTACEEGWRRIAVRGRVGWVEAKALWGAEDCAGL